ncbi:hypothetical protein CLV98_103411 [Dyadobacter jejuensis]|uniref:Uncharacterized protein n=1 Tax=Dyadobacter jejuensis TaxID=1082580 RepID=A0A316ANK4_9BACT|nr:hypothetical protein [Dyadobacter jejuensis]PWJ59038.1 hypothetical protein CLV98_103411 [Dyadobacter jejuensis]
MNKELQLPGKYTVRFQTAPAIPAPFSHYDSLKLDIRSENDLFIDFSIKYLGREELTEDEIYNEGFTMDDDFSWKGKIPPVWIEEFQDIFVSSKMIRRREENEFEDFVEIELEEDHKYVTIYPVDRERWAYFLQEFMQAIVEVAGKEKPFELTYMNIGDEEVSVDLTASFASKSFYIKNSLGREEELPWEQLKRILDIIYSAEFLYEEASDSKPRKKGSYLTAGDGLWYQLGVSVLEPNAKSKHLVEIENTFQDLLTR